jgi:hypothetical protein
VRGLDIVLTQCDVFLLEGGKRRIEAFKRQVNPHETQMIDDLLLEAVDHGLSIEVLEISKA